MWNRYLFFNDSLNLEQSEDGANLVSRPTVMGPFTGLGTHRYPFVHSGDTITTWDTLKFLPYYSLTASNLLVSFITHDLGGHRFGTVDSIGNNDELYTRYLVPFCIV